MTCFCPPRIAPLGALTAPKASLSVGPVPIQMPKLVAMLGLPMPDSAPAPRIDMKMAALLTPMVGQSWVPPKPPALMGRMASLSSLAAFLPLSDISALMAELQQMVSELMENVQPVLSQAAVMPKKPMLNMVMAARMTLSMRAQGLCPMDLSGLDSTFANSEGLPPHPGKMTATMTAVKSTGGRIPRFALPIPMQSMAMTLASLGPLETIPTSLALPPVSSSKFGGAAMAMLAQLARIPPLPLDASKLLSQLAQLTDLAAIQAAFGQGAMTTTGVGKVQAMLNYMSRLPLPPIPPLALGLQPKLDMLPALPAVEAGARIASLNVQTFNQTMSLSPPRVPILSPLMALNALKNVLASILGVQPHQGCPVCYG